MSCGRGVELHLPIRAADDTIEEELPSLSARKRRRAMWNASSSLSGQDKPSCPRRAPLVDLIRIDVESVPDHGVGDVIGREEEGKETTMERIGRESEL